MEVDDRQEDVLNLDVSGYVSKADFFLDVVRCMRKCLNGINSMFVGRAIIGTYCWKHIENESLFEVGYEREKSASQTAYSS